ncbi:hypothetical protein [Methylobrevis pamukkalensis]|uniref:DUF1285 domain-containing protein n=1 Tax=Methylobrevis pamukkalensis TaxID=1439726 RepID=A0A1E3H751_9HYPH|nr:hypothetical protein A6302_01109 [Methylobrevis pamukkalensis]
MPYVHVRRGLDARLTRALAYDLAALVEEEDGVAGVWAGGTFHLLGGHEEVGEEEAGDA